MKRIAPAGSLPARLPALNALQGGFQVGTSYIVNTTTGGEYIPQSHVEQIVLACNCHHNLLKALKALVHAHIDSVYQETAKDASKDEEVLAALAAIEKAGGAA